MVRLRLKREGRTHRPFYHIVAADARSPRDGRFIEEIGYYNPKKDPAEIVIDIEKALKWLKNGAQPTETVKSLLSKQGILLQFHLYKKGKSEEEILKAYQAWKEQADAKNQAYLDALNKKKAEQKAKGLKQEKLKREKIEAKIASKKASQTTEASEA